MTRKSAWIGFFILALSVLFSWLLVRNADPPKDEGRPTDFATTHNQSSVNKDPIPTSDSAGSASLNSGNRPFHMTAFFFRFEGNQLTLSEQRIVEGHVKTLRHVRKTGRVYCKLADRNGNLIWEHSLRDPRLLHYDYLDEEGKLAGGMERLENADFLLRAPVFPNAHSLEIIDFTESDEGQVIFSMTLK